MFLYSAWMRLPIGTRHDIAKQFGIAKVLPTHVQDNVVVQDGYKIEDVERALNVDALQAFTKSTSTDMVVLMDITVLLVEGRQVYDDLPLTAADIQDLNVLVDDKEVIVVLPWCDSCPSKGFRHFKVCPKNKK